jgi:hypothetical protein
MQVCHDLRTDTTDSMLSDSRLKELIAQLIVLCCHRRVIEAFHGDWIGHCEPCLLQASGLQEQLMVQPVVLKGELFWIAQPTERRDRKESGKNVESFIEDFD